MAEKRTIARQGVFTEAEREDMREALRNAEDRDVQRALSYIGNVKYIAVNASKEARQRIVDRVAEVLAEIIEH